MEIFRYVEGHRPWPVVSAAFQLKRLIQAFPFEAARPLRMTGISGWSEFFDDRLHLGDRLVVSGQGKQGEPI